MKRTIVIVLSQASVVSNWVKEELNAALMRRLGDLNIHLLPVLLENCEIPPLISHLRYADFTKNFSTGFRELIDSLLPDQYFWDKLSVLQNEFAASKKIFLKKLRKNHCKDETLEENTYRIQDCEFFLCMLYDLMSQAAPIRYK